MSGDERHEHPCPAAGCGGTLRFAAGLPAGVYQCVCHHINVRVDWITYADFSRTPTVTQAPKDGSPVEPAKKTRKTRRAKPAAARTVVEVALPSMDGAP